jgi:hypothetical protein
MRLVRRGAEVVIPAVAWEHAFPSAQARGQNHASEAIRVFLASLEGDRWK